MGSSESRSRQNGSSQHAGPGLEPGTDRPPAAYRDTEPRIILGNQSSYCVSYWVVEEDNRNKRPNKNHDRLIGCMDTHLNGEKPCKRPPPAGMDEARQEPTNREDEGDAYFLTRDHRMGPRGGTQATKVPFPVNCRKMRVCAYFRVDGQWRLFQDKVYSIGLLRKVFAFAASDADITPCIISAPSSR